jgi:hypothetical protein
MKRKVWAVLLMVLAVGNTEGQSGWTRARGDVFAKLDLVSFQSNRYINLDGKGITTSTYRQQSALLYAEYGLTQRLAIQINFPFLKFNSFATTEKVGGIGDARIEFKYALLRGKFPLAISIAPEIPTGAKNLFAQNKTNAFEKINLPTGDGEFNVWTTLAVSHSFYPTPAYASLFAAYNKRTAYQGQDFQDQLQVGAELGYKVKNRLWLNARFGGLTGLGAKPKVADFIRANGSAFTSYSFQALLELGKHWGVSAQYLNGNSLLFKASNIYSGGIYSIGLVYQRKR